MNRLLALCTALVLAFLAGCSDSTVSGDVFIIKGDGTVTPSAGTTVTFIRADSEQAFFERVRAEALVSAHESVSADFVAQCPAVVDSVKAVLDKLKVEAAAISGRGAVPVGGCDGLEAEMVAAKFALSEQNAEIERLERSVSDAKARRERKLNDVADKLYASELAKVKLRLAGDEDDLYRYRALIFNDSRYCISTESNITFDFYSGDVPVVEKRGYGVDKDKWGALKLGCYLDSRSPQHNLFGLKYSSLNVRLLSGEIAGKIAVGFGVDVLNLRSSIDKLVHEGKLELVPCRHGTRCIKITGLEWSTESDVRFVEVHRKKVGYKTEYSSTPVDWLALAEKVSDFTKEDQSIKVAQEELALAKEKYAANPDVARFDAVIRSANQCIADHQALSETKGLLSEIEDGLARAPDCATGTRQALEEFLPVLNAELSLGFDFPVAADFFQLRFIRYLLLAMASESSRETDTTIEGHYELAGVSKGRYLIFAEYRDNFVDGFWLTPVTIEENEQKVDLNLNTFVGVGFEDYILKVVDLCEDCTAPTYKLPSRRAVLASLPK